MSRAAGIMTRGEDIAQTVLRRAQAADGQRTRASASWPGGCGAPDVAARPNECGPAFGSAQGPRARSQARLPAMGLHRSWTGHTCVTKSEARIGWQGNVARMQGAGQGISSARLLPVSMPANGAADGVIDRLADGGHAALALGARMRMAGPLRVSRSGGPP